MNLPIMRNQPRECVPVSLSLFIGLSVCLSPLNIQLNGRMKFIRDQHRTPEPSPLGIARDVPRSFRRKSRRTTADALIGFSGPFPNRGLLSLVCRCYQLITGMFARECNFQANNQPPRQSLRVFPSVNTISRESRRYTC